MVAKTQQIVVDDDETASVVDSVRAGKYQVKLPYNLEKPFIDPENMTGRQLRELKEAHAEAQKKLRDAYHAEERRLKSLFRQDLEKEHGLVGHPKAGKLYEIAYAHSHSDGHEQIAWTYGELAELLS